MSHYVYLDACPLPRMPDGAAGEWRGFWTERPVELEAKNWPPLLWWCLFGEEDLRRARLIDNIDADDPEGERAALLEQMGEGAGAMHPYLVTDQALALRRLERRRTAVLDGIGARYADVYDGFAALIGRAFGPFILLRTSGLPDVAGAEPAVRAMAAEMDALDTGPPGGRGPGLEGLVAEFRRWSGSDPVWLLSGAGQAELWPTPELAAAYPAARPAAGPDLPATSLAPSTRGRGQGAAALEWLGAVILAGAGLGAYGWTGSILAGIVAFILLAVPVVWWLARRG